MFKKNLCIGGNNVNQRKKETNKGEVQSFKRFKSGNDDSWKYDKGEE